MFLTAILTITSCNDKKEKPATDNTTEVTTETKDTVETTTEEVAKAAVNKEKESLSKPYNETEDADARLNELIAQAKKEGKKVFVQAGGNWCIWCLRFNDFVQKTEELKTVVDQNYLYYHLNYSKNNKNDVVFDKYAPEGKKLGFPFFFVLDGEGKVINIISSVELEENKGYSIEKTKQMFLNNVK